MTVNRTSPWNYVVAEVVAALGLFGSGYAALWLSRSSASAVSDAFLFFSYLFFVVLAVAAVLAVSGFLRGDQE